jgi:hypothetical protein
MTAPAGKTALIIGASRGLGYALAAEYLARGWRVVETLQGLVPPNGTIAAMSGPGRPGRTAIPGLPGSGRPLVARTVRP